MDELIALDQRLLLTLNGSDSLYWDNVMWIVTRTVTWLPLGLVLLFIVLKNCRWRQALLFVVAVGLLILVTDRVSSGLVKPFVHRLRPTHEPALEGLVDLCRGYRGGLYGFFSSHAANTFGLCTFVSLVLRHWRSTFALTAWAMLSSYSRIYLGVHYPGDILCGMLFGFVAGLGMYMLYQSVLVRVEVNKPGATSHCTPSGFPARDCEWLPVTFIGTLLVVAIGAIW